MIDTGTLNLHWARIIVDQLIKQGVDYFCVCPGSRSAPLAIAVAEHVSARPLVHFDERGAAFHAVGYAKGSKKAAAVLVTSGTAAGNLVPALMEAYNERIPLIVITADRPPELRDCGASQTCDQVKLFSDYVRWQCDLPCPTPDISERFLATTIAQAVYQAHGFASGPVHLNCMYRKPLFSQTPHPLGFTTPTQIEHVTFVPSSKSLDECATLFSHCQEGLIIAGSLCSLQAIEPIVALAEKLKWPLLPDILSQVRTIGTSFSAIAYYETLLRVTTELKPKVVLHLGNRIVSKVLKYWLASIPLQEYVQVSNHPNRQDPHHQVTWRFACDLSVFCQEITNRLSENTDTSWLDAWKMHSYHIQKAIEPLFRDPIELTEPGVVRMLQEKLTPDWALFLANSMPIRDADLFLYPEQPIGPLFGNRGVSGIDGNIATASGIAQGCQKPTIALLGDLTVLHDINSLALLKKCTYPLVIIVINNQGGGIFSFLPVAERKNVVEEFFATPHSYSFEHAAHLFQIPYYHMQVPEDFDKWLTSHLNDPHPAIVEIQTERADNYHFHQKITLEAKACLNASLLKAT